MAQDKKKFTSIASAPLTEGIRPDYYSDGGAQKNIKMYQDISNLANYEFALDESVRDFEAATLTRELQVAQTRRAYRDQIKQRDIQMNAALEAYGRNQQFVAQQLAFNEEGARRALADADTVLGDRLKQLQLQEESLALQRQEQAINTAAQKASLDVSDFRASQDSRLQQAQALRAKTLRDTDVALRAERTNLDFGSKDLAIQRARLGVDRQQLGVAQSRLAIDKQRLGIDEQLQDIEAQELSLDRKRYAVDYELDEFSARTAYELQRNQIEQILNLGKERASGRKGVSASRAQQTILALAGFNSARLNDSLNRFTAKTAKERGFLDREADLLETQKGFVDRRSQFVDSESQFVDRQQDFVDKEGKFVNTQQQLNIQERAIATKEQQLSRDKNLATYEASVDSAKAAENVALAGNAVDRERLRQLETVTNNRFKMNQVELGETLLSALNGYKQSKEQIFFDKFKADAQAYANRMATPQFADAPDAPYEIPELTFVPPPIPIEVPKGQVQKQPQQKTSTFGKILSIGGMVLSAAAAPLTAGGSLAIGGATLLTGATGAGVAAMGGAALTGLGQSGWI